MCCSGWGIDVADFIEGGFGERGAAVMDSPTDDSTQRQAPYIKTKLHSVQGRMEPQTMLIPSLAMVAAKLSGIPSGETSDLATIRRELAADAGSDACCPVTTQRHLRDIAEGEVHRHGQGVLREALVPFWRVVDPAKPLARRLAGGDGFIRQRRAEE